MCAIPKNAIGVMAIFLFASLSSLSQAMPIQVGVIGNQSTGAIPDTSNQLRDQLNNDTFFDFNAVSISSGQADSLAELSAYDVVIVGDSGYTSNGYTAPMFAALRSYLDAGGGILSVGWYNYGTDPYTGQQALDADYITPIADGNYNHVTAGGLVDVIDSSHSITSGISDYFFSGRNIEYETAVDAGANVLGGLVGVGGAVTIAYQDLVGRSAYLGGLYMARTTYNNAGLRVGVEDQLLEQAVNWLANGDLVQVPTPATLALFGLGLAGLGWSRRKKV